MNKIPRKFFTPRDLKTLTLALIICRACYFQAAMHWLPDLFCHFVFQYVVAGLVLGLALGWLRQWRYAALAFAVAAISVAQMWFATDYVRPDPSIKPALTIVQFNTLFRNTSHDRLKAWLIANRNRFDVVVLQEATPGLARVTGLLNDAYPYQIAEPVNSARGMIILSRHPILSRENIPLKGPSGENICIHIVIKPPGLSGPVSIYAMHAFTPFGKDHQAQRNLELQTVAARIAADKTPHIVMEGDWNITPYSPWYAKARETAGLIEQRTSLLPLPTWPAWGIPWLTQIPIDHILTDRALTLTGLQTGPAMGSDHLPVVASFGSYKSSPMP